MTEASKVRRIHQTIATSHSKLLRRQVWCRKCGRTQNVDSAECLRHGWPKCHGETMTIDSPEEREAIDRASAKGGASSERSAN